MEWGVVLDNCNPPEDDLTVERISIEVKTHLSILLSNLYEIEQGIFKNQEEIDPEFAAQIEAGVQEADKGIRDNCLDDSK